MEPAARSAAGADAERFVGLEVLIQRIEQNPKLLALPVDVNLYPVSEPGAVIGKQHVVPAVGCQSPLRFYPDRVIQPTYQQPEVNFPVLERQAIALPLLHVPHAGQYSPSLLSGRINPSARGKLVVETEGAEVTGLDEPFTVEFRRLGDPAGDERGFPVFKSSVRCFLPLCLPALPGCVTIEGEADN